MRESDVIMAYHCKFFAVQTGLKLCGENPGAEANLAKAALMQELSDLEGLKSQMGSKSKEEL